MSALQILNEKDNVVGSSLLAEDDAHYYAILPVHSSTLLDYISEFGYPTESEARYFFVHILQVRQFLDISSSLLSHNF